MKNTGKEAEKAFLERMARPGVIVERLRDAADLRGLNGGRAIADFAKPSDFLVTQHGLLHYAEVKSVQGAVSFPFGNIEDGQHVAATKQAAVGGPYWFYLFSYGLGQWFLMSCRVYADTVAAGKASIKFKDLPKW